MPLRSLRVCLCWSFVLLGAGRALSAQAAATPPALLLGRFVDDYGIPYRISSDALEQGTRSRYRITEWHPDAQFLVAQQAPDSAGRAPWVRIDWMTFADMPPYQWGYCFTVYDAPSADAARGAPPADRQRPRSGCGGYPFSRMRRADP